MHGADRAVSFGLIPGQALLPGIGRFARQEALITRPLNEPGWDGPYLTKGLPPMADRSK